MANAINRWEPASQLPLRDAVNQLFADSWVRPLGGWTGGSQNHLPIDLYETDEAFFVKAFVPGISPEHLDITARQNTLTIRAEQPAETQEGVRYYLRERVGGAWLRTFELPYPIDTNAVEAKLEHGVLTLTLPKAPEAKPHKVQITAS